MGVETPGMRLKTILGSESPPSLQPSPPSLGLPHSSSGAAVSNLRLATMAEVSL